MALNLKKGDSVTLKGDQKVTKAQVGLGWDPAKSGQALDADAAIIGRDVAGKAREEWVCFFNQLDIKWARHSGDTLTGEGELDASGDDERIFINLPAVPPEVNAIDVVITLFEAAARGQSFGDFSMAFARLAKEDTGEEICRFDLAGDKYFTNTGMVVATIKRKGPTWEFMAVGEGFDNADLNALFSMTRP